MCIFRVSIIFKRYPSCIQPYQYPQVCVSQIYHLEAENITRKKQTKKKNDFYENDFIKNFILASPRIPECPKVGKTNKIKKNILETKDNILMNQRHQEPELERVLQKGQNQFQKSQVWQHFKKKPIPLQQPIVPHPKHQLN